MRIKIQIVTGLTLAFVLGFSFNAWLQESPTEVDNTMQATATSIVDKSQSNGPFLAAVYSRICQTNIGACRLEVPQEVGSTCWCGTTQGTVAQ